MSAAASEESKRQNQENPGQSGKYGRSKNLMVESGYSQKRCLTDFPSLMNFLDWFCSTQNPNSAGKPIPHWKNTPKIKASGRGIFVPTQRWHRQYQGSTPRFGARAVHDRFWANIFLQVKRLPGVICDRRPRPVQTVPY